MKRLFAALGAFALLVSGCGTTPVLADLPMPSTLTGQTTLVVQNLKGVEDVSVETPSLSVSYGNTGEGAGSIQSEIVRLNTGKAAKLIKFSWGEYLTNGRIESAQVFASNGKALEARITLRMAGASLLQLFTGPRYTVDRSRLVLQYLANDGVLTLSTATYMEEWGVNASGAQMAYGLQAWWKNADTIFPAYRQWGFWEVSENAFGLVAQALEESRRMLQITRPSYMVVDQDGLREVIGRQTGMKLYRDGMLWGSVNFRYSNTWGPMPNTPAIGKGALSRIEWEFGGQYRALSILASQFSPRPTAIYVFSQSRSQAEFVEGTKWVPLYGMLNAKSEQVKDVLLSVYSAGHVGKLTSLVTTSEGSGTADIGDGGGVFYGFFGQANILAVAELRSLIDLTGLPGVKALGLYYPTSELSGSGLHYYLAISQVALNGDKGLDSYGQDVGLLDRVGFPDQIYGK